MAGHKDMICLSTFDLILFFCFIVLLSGDIFECYRSIGVKFG